MESAQTPALLAVLSQYQWLLVTVCVVISLNMVVRVLRKRSKDRKFIEAIQKFPDDTGKIVDFFTNPEGTKYEHISAVSRTTLPEGTLIDATEPDSAKCILAGVDKKTNYNWQLLLPYLGSGLLTSQGDKWSRSRKMLTPAFHFGVLKDYVHLFQISIEPYLTKWAKSAKIGESVDVTEDIDDLTLKALLKCAFGDFPMTESEQSEVKKSIKDIAAGYTDRFGKTLLFFDFIFYLTSSGRKFRDGINKTRNLARGIIREKKRQQERGEVSKKKYKDFLDIITEARDENGKPLTEDEMLDEVQTFFFAGHDTTASAIPYVLYNLAKHPEYQERCRNEIDQVLGEEKDLKWTDLAKMEFLNMCIKETLRLHPPVAGINRKSTQPTVLPDGTILPTDTAMGVRIYTIMHNPKFWKDPFVFDPYRFDPENKKLQHPYAYIPFSAGSRNCIGQNFALTEIRVCTIATLRRFRLSLDPVKPLNMCYNFLLKTASGMWLRFEEV